MRVVYILWGLVLSWMVAALYFGPTKRIPDIDPDAVPPVVTYKKYRLDPVEYGHGRPCYEDSILRGDV